MIFRLWRLAVIGVLSAVLTLSLFTFRGAGTVAAENQDTQIEVELTESFYKALSADDTKTYSTDKSEEYLRQIAVSARFAVESNLKLLKQQERMIELLEAIRKQAK